MAHRVVFLEAASRAKLRDEVERLRRRLAAVPAHGPIVCPALGRLGQERERLAVVASSNADAVTRLELVSRRLDDPSCRRIHDPRGAYYFEQPLGAEGKTAILFPGDRALYPGALARLAETFPPPSRWFHPVFRAVGLGDSGFSAAREPVHFFDAVWLTFAANMSFFDRLRELGISPDMAAGLSSGELAAVIATGCVRLAGDDDLVGWIDAARWLLVDLIENGRRANVASFGVVAPDPRVIPEVLERHPGRLFLAADNCANHALLGGFAETVDQAVAELAKRGAICERWNEPIAVHTPLIKGSTPKLLDLAATATMGTIRPPLYSCATAARFPEDPEQARLLLVKQWLEPVRFRETIEAMYDAGARVFVESGPRGSLSGFVDEILRGRPHVAIPLDLPSRGAQEQMCHAIALCTAHHLAPVIDAAYADVAANRERDERPSGGSRGRLMAAWLQTMGTFVRDQGDVMSAYLRSGRSGRPAQCRAAVDAQWPRLPFVRTFERTANEIVASYELDLEEDLFLRDHALGGRVSRIDEALSGLPIVPLAVSLEMMAEVAWMLAPHLLVVGLRSVTAHRWIALDAAPLPLEIAAKRILEGEVRVRIRPPSAARGEAYVEGTVLLATTYPDAPDARSIRCERLEPCALRRSDFYEGPSRRTFQGPLFQSIEHVERTGLEGAEVVLEPPAADRFFRSRSAPAFVLGPIAMEAIGQAAFAWLETQHKTPFSFPTRVGHIDLHGPPHARPGKFRCLVREREVSTLLARSDAIALDDTGRALVTVGQWTDIRAHVPERLCALVVSPLDTFLSVPSPKTGPGARHLDALDPAFLDGLGGLWHRVIRDVALTREERRGWSRWGATDGARSERVTERVVMKDAVRSVIKARTGILWGAADIDLGPEAAPLSTARGPWGEVNVAVSRDGSAYTATASEG
ncbi:MAG: acyltransferase domain-containing protein [Deltaproteobacteria bacterium]|nr:MAG: acyltransferase domain-containing protein [Deltaproteobacteria bacterium]